MQRDERRQKKIIESKISQLRDSQLYSEFPDNDILGSDQAIIILKDKTGNDQEIADSINLLIQSHKLVTSQGMYNKVYLRKNRYAK
jgi:hypothetical protein